VTSPVLVIGYGNSLRTDDGVGRRVAERLLTDRRLEGAAVIACHQLTPELALDLSGASLAVLVDASTIPPPGTWAIEPLPAARSASSGSHHVDAAELVELASALYGHAPEVVTVSVGAASFDVGERLSPVVEAAVPGVVEAVVALVSPHLAAAAPTRPRVAEGPGRA
jgi:hydrogenase maturation protease